ncbi:MAG: aminotransferase [Waddliaceae bacterium]|nr:aminotransferase [Waddliaceae bacterium]
MSRYVYLDNITRTAPAEEVVRVIKNSLSEHWASPMAPHQIGQDLIPVIQEALKTIYSSLGAREVDTFILTSCGAEAVNHVLHSVYHDITRHTGKNHYVSSKVGEAATIVGAGHLEQLGCSSTMAEVDEDGMLSADKILDAMTPRTALVSISWANPLTGVVNPIHDILDLCKERGALLHVEASQAIGKEFFYLEDLAIDYLTFDGSLIHGPQGTGGLHIRAGAELSPFIYGEADQAGRRAGNWNIPGLLGLSEAVKQAIEQQDLMGTEVARLRRKLEEGIQKAYPEAKILYESSIRLPHITAISFPGIANDALLHALNKEKVYANFGGGALQQLSLMLMNSGISPEIAQSTLSFSLSRYTSDEEIDLAVERIASCAQHLRKLSKHLV